MAMLVTDLGLYTTYSLISGIDQGTTLIHIRNSNHHRRSYDTAHAADAVPSVSMVVGCPVR